MNILEEIIAYKKIEIDRAKEKLPLDKLKNLVKVGLKPTSTTSTKRKFYKAIKDKVDKKEIALIAEIKKASPSKGLIKSDFNHIEIAKAYKNGGATCLSVLTDEKYFQGNLKFIQGIKEVEACRGMPILRKDFIIDPYQIYESIYNEADCILLIVGALDKDILEKLFEISCENEIDVLIEVHDEKEMEIALELDCEMIGINNRDLTTFKTNLETTKSLVKKYKRDLQDKIIVSESGIFTNSDIKSLVECGVYAFLVGESLMKAGDIEEATKILISF